MMCDVTLDYQTFYAYFNPHGTAITLTIIGDHTPVEPFLFKRCYPLMGTQYSGFGSGYPNVIDFGSDDLGLSASAPPEMQTGDMRMYIYDHPAWMSHVWPFAYGMVFFTPGESYVLRVDGGFDDFDWIIP